MLLFVSHYVQLNVQLIPNNDPMKIISLQVDRDIQPLSEFRANAASFIQRVKTYRRPLILTQHGKSSVVLLDVEGYQ